MNMCRPRHSTSDELLCRDARHAVRRWRVTAVEGARDRSARRQAGMRDGLLEVRHGVSEDGNRRYRAHEARN